MNRFSIAFKFSVFTFLSFSAVLFTIHLLLPLELNSLLIIPFLMAVVFSFIFGLVIYFWIEKPIEETILIAKDMTNGNFSRKLHLSRQDTVGQLAVSLNQMSVQTQMRIEEEVTNKSRLEAVFLSMFEGVMLVDSEGTILLINQRLRDFLNITQKATGQKPLEIIRNVEMQEIINNALKLTVGSESSELTVLVPEEKALLVHAAPVIREGKIEGAILVFHDITQLRRLENIRQDFVANVSHELRTPVSTIKGYAETLLDGALEDKENARDFVQIIHSDADRLAKLVNDLLDLSQIESGKMKLQLTKNSIGPIVDKVVGTFAKQIKEKSIRITRDIPPNLASVLADETSVSQILMNLIENAIKYNKVNGSIDITAYELDSRVHISIKDTGIGIPPEDIPRIFERFYRVDKARSRQLGGTGLGLSIVKHLVLAHQGEVHVESQLNQGATFSFTLPKV